MQTQRPDLSLTVLNVGSFDKTLMQMLTEVERKKGFKPIQIAELHADAMEL
jgi:hypothetical protein